MFGSKPTWGWLYPYQDNLPIQALKERSYVVGVERKDAVLITEEHVGGRLSSEQFATLQHDPHLFKVKRTDDQVMLKVTTTCDIFLNKTKVIKQKEKYALRHNDCLSIIRPEAKVFVYLDNEAVETADFPKEIKEKYAASKKIGEGAFGVVTLMFQKKTGKKFAVKKIIKNPKLQKYAEIEKKILTTVNHRHVIHMEDKFETPGNLYMVLEYMEGGDLSSRIRRSSGLIESIAKFFFYQITLAVDYLHDLGIAHRDLKPENILLSSDNVYCLVKVTDFGVSKAEWDTKLRTSLGTLTHEAPEVIRASETGKAYTNKVDVWSLGVILFYSLSGKLPFQSVDQILSGTFRFTTQTLTKISTTSVDIVKKMLYVDPVRRLGIKEILAHEWLKDRMMRSKVESLSNGVRRPEVPGAATHVASKKEVARQLQVPVARPVPVPGVPILAEKQIGPVPAQERKFLNERRQGQPRGVLRFMSEDRPKPPPAQQDRAKPLPAQQDRAKPLPVPQNQAKPLPAPQNQAKPPPSLQEWCKPPPTPQNRPKPLPAQQDRATPLPHPQHLEPLRRIDNRRTQPFPGVVKNNLLRFENNKM